MISSEVKKLIKINQLGELWNTFFGMQMTIMKWHTALSSYSVFCFSIFSFL